MLLINRTRKHPRMCQESRNPTRLGRLDKARRGAAVWQLADIVIRQPVVDAATVARELRVSPQNAHRAIAPLDTAGILEEFTGFARNRMWQSRHVLTALDEFAARAGRRPSERSRRLLDRLKCVRERHAVGARDEHELAREVRTGNHGVAERVPRHFAMLVQAGHGQTGLT